MLKIVQSLALVIFTFFTVTAQKKEQYNIKLNVKGLTDSTCYLAHYYLNSKSQIVKDTAIAQKNGDIIFTGDNELPKGIYIIAIGKSRSVQLVIGDNNLEMACDTTFDFDKIKVIKGIENMAFYEYQKYMGDKSKSYRILAEEKAKRPNPKVDSVISIIQKDIVNYQKSFFEKNKNLTVAKLLKSTLQPDIPEAPVLPNGKKDSTFALKWIQKHYFDNLDLSDEMFIKTPFLDDKVDYYLENLNYQIPDSLNKAIDFMMSKANGTKNMQKYLASHTGNKYERPNFMGGDAVFVHVAGKYFKDMPTLWDSTTLKAVEEKRIALKNVMIGTKAQNLQLTDTTGRQPFDLHTFKSKYTVLFIYDPECGHCKERAPKLLKFSEKLKDKQIKVVAISTIAEPSKINKFVKDQKTSSFLNVYDRTHTVDFRNKYNVFTTPQVLLLDENKKILARGIDEDQMEDLINNIEKSKK